MMDVMIVDDEPVARRTLRECCAREPDLNIVGEFGDARSALEEPFAPIPRTCCFWISRSTPRTVWPWRVPSIRTPCP